MSNLSSVHEQTRSTSAALLAAHKTRARQELMADLCRLFWRDHPEATGAEFDLWRERTEAQIRRLP